MQHRLTFNIGIDYSHVEDENATFSGALPFLERAVEMARGHGALGGDDVVVEDIKVSTQDALSSQREAFNVTVTYEPLYVDMIDAQRLTSLFVSVMEDMRLNGALTSPFYAAENLSVKLNCHEVSVQNCLNEETNFVDINNITLVKDNDKAEGTNSPFCSLPFSTEVPLGYSPMLKDADGNMLPVLFP
ncbi:hypothetical protein BM525_19610 (plasmid) [Alteromonas mediterranea]|uniref:Uncharacterized protein n=1 Tax=Alteromonas mediterranea TaxID=314275 RepID=A0AAC9JEY6_9ALTE|nr:hypothetical protein [Alteromonas mediterranea]APD92091.1 hypothetical protein BM524_19415 [Alteromonas mediterranea]APD99945.1 hypothetical protein BM525_19610 [Alteromonas mediterranea]